MTRSMRARAAAWSARSNGPTLPYMLGSAECCATFGKPLTRNEADAMHQLAIDAYAVSHPGDRGDRPDGAAGRGAPDAPSARARSRCRPQAPVHAAQAHQTAAGVHPGPPAVGERMTTEPSSASAAAYVRRRTDGPRSRRWSELASKHYARPSVPATAFPVDEGWGPIASVASGSAFGLSSASGPQVRCRRS